MVRKTNSLEVKRKEAKIVKCLERIAREPKASVSRIAREEGVSLSTLKYRRRGGHSTADYYEKYQLLTRIEEEQLTDSIVNFCRQGKEINRESFYQMVDAMIDLKYTAIPGRPLPRETPQKRPDNGHYMSRNWVYCFLDRNPRIKYAKAPTYRFVIANVEDLESRHNEPIQSDMSVQNERELSQNNSESSQSNPETSQSNSEPTESNSEPSQNNPEPPQNNSEPTQTAVETSQNVPERIDQEFHKALESKGEIETHLRKVSNMILKARKNPDLLPEIWLWLQAAGVVIRSTVRDGSDTFSNKRRKLEQGKRDKRASLATQPQREPQQEPQRDPELEQI